MHSMETDGLATTSPMEIAQVLRGSSSVSSSTASRECGGLAKLAGLEKSLTVAIAPYVNAESLESITSYQGQHRGGSRPGRPLPYPACLSAILVL